MTNQSWIDHLRKLTLFKMTGGDPDRAVYMAEDIIKQLEDEKSDLICRMENEANSGEYYVYIDFPLENNHYDLKEIQKIEDILSKKYPDLYFSGEADYIRIDWMIKYVK